MAICGSCLLVSTAKRRRSLADQIHVTQARHDLLARRLDS
jgi:hypothetical protein